MKKTIEILSWIGHRIGKPPGWERVVHLFASPEKCRAIRDICLVRDGFLFLARPFVPVGWHVALFGTYEPELREILKVVLPSGGVAVDVGANVGWHTLLMARLVGDSGRVFAAEANPSVRKSLEDNLKLNRFGQVQVLPYAIAATEGTVDFHGPEADDAGSGDGHVVTVTANSRPWLIRVESRPLDAIFLASPLTRLDLIKIDVEGFEWPVFQGAEQTISQFRPHIIFEYNAEYAHRGGGTPALLDAYFQKHQYRLFALGRTWAEAVQLRNWPQCADIWAIPTG